MAKEVDGKGEGRLVATMLMSKKGQRLEDGRVAQDGITCISVKRKLYEWKMWLNDKSKVLEVCRLRNSLVKEQRVPQSTFDDCQKNLRIQRGKLTTLLDTSGTYFCIIV